jgi:hypothetical protein
MPRLRRLGLHCRPEAAPYLLLEERRHGATLFLAAHLLSGTERMCDQS